MAVVTETLFDDLQQHVQCRIIGYKIHLHMSYKDTLLDPHAQLQHDHSTIQLFHTSCSKHHIPKDRHMF